MKRSRRFLVFIFVFSFVFSMIMSSFAFADSKSADKSKENQGKNAKTTVQEIEAQNSEASLEGKKVNENKALEVKERQAAGKTEFAKLPKEEKQRIKAEIISIYSDEEMAMLQEAAEDIEENNSDVDVLPVDSIVIKNKKVKWDIPPVVKSGRILVPVRALTQAYGAQVAWDQEEQKITIIKDGKEIVIELNSKTVYVDGVAIELDVPAQSINSRTVVPLRFIAEQLGLKVNFDDETDTVEIDEDEETDEDTTDEGTTDDTATDDTAADGTTTDETAESGTASDETAADGTTSGGAATGETSTDDTVTDDTTGEDTTQTTP